MNKLEIVMQEQVWALERLRRALSRRFFKVTSKIDKQVTANVFNQVEDAIILICKDYNMTRRSKPMHLKYLTTVTEVSNESSLQSM